MHFMHNKKVLGNRMPEAKPAIEEIQRIWEQAECLRTEDQVSRAIDAIAAKIEKDLQHTNPLVLCVMKGGLVFCGQLLLRLPFPLEVDYLHATRYGQKTEGGELEWIVDFSVDVKDRTILIVDDILDRGQTLAAIVEQLQTLGAKQVKTAVLVDKQLSDPIPDRITADYVAMKVEDRFLFGFGMDFKGYFRNAAGIYAAVV